jgi:1-deoxy-D-xylulose-5-phosphate reductoisomerase
MVNLAILGVSGSIGKQAIEVILEHKDEFNLVGISVFSNIDYALSLLNDFSSIIYVGVKDEVDAAKVLKEHPSITVFIGEEGLSKIAVLDEVDLLVNALVGFLGLLPTIKAIRCKKDIALANKETLVVAGHIIMKEIELNGVNLYPIDSEHSAITQCLEGESYDSIKRIIITASGGPFYRLTKEELNHVTLKDALKHPNWSMGAKITIDSASMVNKGLEVIEAHWLFNLPYDKISVLIHPQSIVHSLVEFNDGALKAQLGVPSMKVPILYALSRKKRLLLNDVRLDLAKAAQLNFMNVDFDRFRTLALAYKAGIIGHSLPTVYNGANEVAVKAFMDGKIKFTQIEELIALAMDNHQLVLNPSLEEIIAIDRETRAFVNKYI